MIKSEIVKEKRNYLSDLIRITKSKEYLKYIESDSKLNEEINEYNKLSYWEVQYYDLVNNIEMNTLLRKISCLNRNKYNVHLNLRVSKYITINYFDIQYDHSSITAMGKIECLDDEYIKAIYISYSQINNNEAIIIYNIQFNKIIKHSDIIDYIEANKIYFPKNDFTTHYHINNYIKDNKYDQINFFLLKVFNQISQCKLANIFKLGLGTKYILPSITVINYPEDLYTEDDFINIFLGTMFKTIERQQYLVFDCTYEEGLEMKLYFAGDKFSNISLSGLISSLRMEFYYYMFDNIERIELNQRMNKYFSKANIRIKSNDYKWLVNKLRAIRDNHIHSNRNLLQVKELAGWKQFRDGEEVELDLIGCKFSKKYEAIYSECLDYIRTLYGLQKENFIIIIAFWTLIFTMVGILTTIIGINLK